jgi:hypothetical protein
MRRERSFNALAQPASAEPQVQPSSEDSANPPTRRGVAIHPLIHPSPRKTPARVESRGGAVAQLVEQGTFNAKVQGSSPCGPIAHDPIGNALLGAAVAIIVILACAFYADETQAHTIHAADCRAIARSVDASLAAKRAAARGCTRHRTQHASAHQLAACAGRVPCIIRYVFGPYGDQAVAVSWCESTHRTTAANGQYLGLFQMGSSERATYGHGSTALVQSQAAHRYFVASGSDWSPWECKP